ncbi:glycosyltransferase family 9 protein [Jeongeupia naejangsanensis]|uniref:ADP-heptose--LPS heptosyltransferase n=1 Tax=Jeongeupia naejangsanensis TaxID=613195 RepID=A0ABS2BLP3_9NEIS|nr:hypothetical protein [Jeongeupia naejangsanensis]MBM3116537.1 hypothetical protein [Jeongeupia naejangsanensis]
MKRAVKSVIMQGGQGDAIMAAYGMAALHALKPGIFADDVVCYPRSLAAPLIQALMPWAKVLPIDKSNGSAHPRFYTSAAKTTLGSAYKNWFGPDWINNFAERRRQASTGYQAPGGVAGLARWLTDKRLIGNTRWRREAPDYYAIKMWAPLAEYHGFSEIDLGRALYATVDELKANIGKALGDYQSLLPVPTLAVFPSGASFQTMPPAFLARLVAALPGVEVRAFFGPGDATMADYAALGIACEITPTLNDVLYVLRHAPAVITVDSFVSHLAQLFADGHIAAMSHDLPVHTVHPGAASRIVFKAMPCVPCNYLPKAGQCAAGFKRCGVYERGDYFELMLRTIRGVVSEA